MKKEQSFSDQIRACRDGAAANPYQGTDPKVLFVCSMGILRSATAARLYAKNFNTRSAGSWGDALIPITPILIAWADEIVFVNIENYNNVLARFGQDCLKDVPSVRVLAIPDQYPHMDSRLIQAFEEQYAPIPKTV